MKLERQFDTGGHYLNVARALQSSAPKGIEILRVQQFRMPPPACGAIWLVEVTCQGKPAHVQSTEQGDLFFPTQEILTKLELIAP